MPEESPKRSGMIIDLFAQQIEKCQAVTAIDEDAFLPIAPGSHMHQTAPYENRSSKIQKITNPVMKLSPGRIPHHSSSGKSFQFIVGSVD
jgi:hypothetical protein